MSQCIPQFFANVRSERSEGDNELFQYLFLVAFQVGEFVDTDHECADRRIVRELFDISRYFLDQFVQALGASGSPNQSNKQIGMQFANAGLQAPQIPNVPLMQNMNQQTIQRQAPQTFNPLLQMLLNGGK